jgi:tRNA 5-methylaminomethyl-2-thiouridine biosynthesis bifunctional protein
LTEPEDLSRASPLLWDADGAPRSRLFNDIYFSNADGLEESRAVYLHGCGLPQAWAGRQRFAVAELGFGTGLNILALLDLWRATRPAGGRLQVFSVEAFPLSAAEAGRALAAWPDLADLATAMLAQWPRQARGFHRLDFPELGATLDLAVMEAAEALAAWDGRADAWFLDGFAPSVNPQMWREEVLALVAARSEPGARAATFTVAGAVRRGLAAQGFEVEKRPGFGAKLQRLEARLPEAPPPPSLRAQRICIVGAGIAGAALARAFRAEGLEVQVVDPRGPGGGASGNPAAMVTPRLDAGGGMIARLHAQAFHRAVDLLGAVPGAVISRGAFQLEMAERDARRFDAITTGDLFAPDAVTRLDRDQASDRLGEPAPAGGLWQAEALVVEPRAVLSAWLGDVTPARVTRLERDGGTWRLFDGDALVAEADIVCLAAGLEISSLARGLPLRAVRGQVSFLAGPERPGAGAWGGYVVPTRDGLLFGSTHDRDDLGEDVRPADDLRNLQALAEGRPRLAAELAGRPLSARAGVRAAARDHLPVAGLAPGETQLLVLGGFGGRGFCLAPLLAEHVAALALGLASPLPRDLATLVDPGRASVRKAL